MLLVLDSFVLCRGSVQSYGAGQNARCTRLPQKMPGEGVGWGGRDAAMAHLIRVIGDMSPPVQLSVSSDSSVRNCHSLSTCTEKASSDLGFSIGFQVTGFRQTPDLRGKPLLLGLVPRRSRHEDAMSCGVTGKRGRLQY